MNRDDSVAALRATPLCCGVSSCIVECNVFVRLDAAPVSMESEHKAQCRLPAQVYLTLQPPNCFQSLVLPSNGTLMCHLHIMGCAANRKGKILCLCCSVYWPWEVGFCHPGWGDDSYTAKGDSNQTQTAQPAVCRITIFISLCSNTTFSKLCRDWCLLSASTCSW